MIQDTRTGIRRSVLPAAAMLLAAICATADAQTIGQLSANPYQTGSTSNPYSSVGSPYSPSSIRNPYGQYGSPYRHDSPKNPYGKGWTIVAPE